MQQPLPLGVASLPWPADDASVPPAFLRRIAPQVCPVTRSPLTRATGTPTDAVVDCANAGAGFEIGNLAVISVQAASARQGRSVEDALDLARQARSDPVREIAGLGPREWARLAALISFTTPLPHDRAAAIALCVLPPARLRLVNPVQALQAMLALQFTRAGHPRRCAALAEAMPSPQARYAFNSLMLTLLARRIAAGRPADALAERHAVEDAWCDPVVQRRWERLANALTAGQCERLCEFAAERGLAGRGVRWIPGEVAYSFTDPVIPAT